MTVVKTILKPIENLLTYWTCYKIPALKITRGRSQNTFIWASSTSTPAFPQGSWRRWVDASNCYAPTTKYVFYFSRSL